MIVVKFKPDHLTKIQLQQNQSHFYHWLNPENYTHLSGFTIIVDNRIVFIGGISQIHQRRYIAWSLLSYDCGKYLTAIIRKIKQYINNNYVGFRVECTCDYNFSQAHRMAKLIGFKCEAELMKSYEIDGRDSKLYAMIVGGENG